MSEETDQYVDGVVRRAEDAVEAALRDVARHVEGAVARAARQTIAALQGEVAALKGQLAACWPQPPAANVTFFASVGESIEGAMLRCLFDRGPFQPGTVVRIVLSVPPVQPEALVLRPAEYDPWARVHLELIGPYALLALDVEASVAPQDMGSFGLHRIEVRGPVRLAAPGGVTLRTSGDTRFRAAVAMQVPGGVS